MESSKFTIKDSWCPLFGKPRELRLTILPTYKDIILCCNEERRKIGRLSNNGKQEPKFSDIAEKVSVQVIGLYEKVFIPHVTNTRVLQLINSLHEDYRRIKIYLHNLTQKTSPALQIKIDNFKIKCEKLFDIACCKCKNFESCECPVTKRVPLNVQKFLLDQRNGRECRIRDNLTKFTCKKDVQPSDSQTSSDNFKSSQSTYDSSQEFFDPGKNIKKEPIVKQARVNINNTVLVAQRYGLSDRATAAISTAVLVDHGIVSPADSSLVLDKNKIRRSKRRLNALLTQIFNNDLVPCKNLYFDGRKDSTILQIKQGSKYKKSIIKEEHISVLTEPESTYIGHFVPLSGSGQDICDGLHNLILEKGVVNDLEAIACDGTVINTGWKNGVIRCLERKIGRPLQWIICLLQFNELPFRALFIHRWSNRWT